MQEIGKDILIRASQGDQPAFEEVYKATASFVYNVAYRIVNNREDAQEVSQQVFLTVYDKLKSFRFESSFTTWVYRITANHAINFAKKNSRVKTVAYEEALVPASSPSDVHLQAERDYNNRVIEELLDAVNPDQRACLVLRNIEGLSYEAIAHTLNININTVRTRLKRAREKLLAMREKVNHDNM